MKKFATEEIRNVGVLGGGRAGKTSLSEALIYFNKGIAKLGSVDEGGTVMDFDPDEIDRKNSHHAALASLETSRGKLNLVDTPGISNFLCDTEVTCRVVDGALIVIGAAGGVKYDTERIWKYTEENELPRMVVVTEMDKERADFEKLLEDHRRIEVERTQRLLAEHLDLFGRQVPVFDVAHRVGEIDAVLAEESLTPGALLVSRPG